MQTKQTILCVDNNKDTCELVTFVFQNVGFEVSACATPEEGIRKARTNDYAAIITDLYLDGMDGIDFCRIIRTFNANTPIIFFTGEARETQKQSAMEAGAQAYIVKPADFEQLEQTVVQLIRKSEKER